MALNNNIKGALLMALAMASFNFNDAMIKLVTGDLTAGQIMFIRGIMTSMMILAVAWRLGALRPATPYGFWNTQPIRFTSVRRTFPRVGASSPARIARRT